jgi:Fe-S oxidoreductase
MAKMKSEFLYHYQEKHGYSLRSRLFANFDTLGRLGSLFPSLSNKMQEHPLTKEFLRKIGISTERALPQFAEERFSSSVKNPQNADVVLFNDTFTEYHYPHLGRSTVAILQSMGFSPLVPKRVCCGRPMISKGFLGKARRQGEKLIKTLLPFAKKGCAIVGIEPSCILTIKDDLYGLVPSKDAETVSRACVTIDEFLYRNLKRLPKKELTGSVKLHGHCYQKALTGTEATLEVLRSVQNLQVGEIATGCCGMAGSFGYEAEHEQFSLQVGEDRLFPAVRALDPDAFVVANGASCRSQISHGTQRQAIHLVELLS